MSWVFFFYIYIYIPYKITSQHPKVCSLTFLKFIFPRIVELGQTLENHVAQTCLGQRVVCPFLVPWSMREVDKNE